tara:strand:+ start:128 stop:556 length:429 start_codon:yes stop_codon:yes gene_type:complete
MIDTTMGMNNQAAALMEFMKGTEPDFVTWNEIGDDEVSFETKPWYNGRERGFVLSMEDKRFGTKNKAINIAVFEHRSSDDLVAWAWLSNGFAYNEIGLDDVEFNDDDLPAYDNHSVDYGRIDIMAKWIYDTLANYYNNPVLK